MQGFHITPLNQCNTQQLHLICSGRRETDAIKYVMVAYVSLVFRYHNRPHCDVVQVLWAICCAEACSIECSPAGPISADSFDSTGPGPISRAQIPQLMWRLLPSFLLADLVLLSVELKFTAAKNDTTRRLTSPRYPTIWLPKRWPIHSELIEYRRLTSLTFFYSHAAQLPIAILKIVPWAKNSLPPYTHKEHKRGYPR